MTKVARGEVTITRDDTDRIGDAEIDLDDEDEDEEKSDDKAMDTDGDYKKSVMTGYGDDESEAGGSNAAMSDQGELAVDFEDTEADVTMKKEVVSEFMKMLREKYSKYLPYIKGDLEFEEGKSATITLQFPLEFKKLLVLTLADAAL